MKFKQSPGDPADEGSPIALDGPRLDKEGYPIVSENRSGMAASNGRARLRIVNESMDNIVRRLEVQVRAPIVDGTGLNGRYDFVLSWSTERMSTAPESMAPGPTIFEALRSQLGLNLEKRKGLVRVLVVDSALKTPSAN